MEYAIIGLLSIAIILLIISFFGRDKVKVLEEQVDQLTLTVMQESYVLKKKLKVLEEELLMNDTSFEITPTTSNITKSNSD
ncbi:hypothetical protein [Fredinandcohnia quinoae]|uniref:Uncharacterized protein n=1 Tax=Fredinandcohnia quinoae TaxID=2918902 RepID=A0AAW5E2D6_9BACI|nr:hypothetical protein [Fredinandcohnia sp. SECRCQ15]MCH1624934.1 hypothetical protein [Fredinandcohnia sp. SECRCQ15]